MSHLAIKAWIIVLLGSWVPKVEAKESEALSIDVPERYAGAKFRISGELMEPKEGKLTIEGYLRKRRRIETLDSKHRILNDSYNRLKKNSLVDSRSRYFRFGPTVGLVQLEKNIARKLYVDPSMSQFGADALFQPGLFGLVAGLSRARGACRRSSGSADVCGEIHLDTFRLGVSSEFVPFRKGPLFFQRPHLGLNLGMNRSQQKIVFGDSEFEVHDKSVSYGGFSNLELRNTIGMNFWWFIRAGYAYQRLKFEKIYFNEDLHQFHFSVGVRYAI